MNKWKIRRAKVLQGLSETLALCGILFFFWICFHKETVTGWFRP